jgi:NhaP-type Na+/H+ or K+/H+ antiporter
VPVFAIWDAATFVLNVLAFTLIGLQMRPILDSLNATERVTLPLIALAILAAVILVRLLFAMAYLFLHRMPRLFGARARSSSLSAKGALVTGWSGMRGIVTLAAAMALPAGFPYHDFIQLTAFVVVIGTLVIQGLTLRPLLVALHLPKDTTVEMEIGLARTAALKAALAELDGDKTPAAQRLKLELQGDLAQAARGRDPHDSPDNMLRRHVLPASRRAIDELRRTRQIGDDAFRLVEAELDRLELSSDVPD